MYEGFSNFTSGWRRDELTAQIVRDYAEGLCRVCAFNELVVRRLEVGCALASKLLC